MAVRTRTQYEAAKRRIAELAGCLEGSPEEREMIAVQLAIEIWETRHRMP